MATKGRHSITPVSTLGRFFSVIDCELHRINIVYLVKGYNLRYSLTVATLLLLLALTFAFPTERPLYVGVVSLLAQSFSVLMIAGGLYCATGGVFTRRRQQEEWLLGNVKDVLHLLMENASSFKAGYMLLALEAMARLGNVLQGSACVCALLLLWICWLLLKMNSERP
ncbi:hypothetical protein TcBrA4_0029870 [Trypanosoma cruzi]|nr:hypothetical protein TcBrA4_0029870 [Trypanosoma cruzi]